MKTIVQAFQLFQTHPRDENSWDLNKLRTQLSEFNCRIETLPHGFLIEIITPDEFKLRIIYFDFYHDYFISYIMIPENYVWSQRFESQYKVRKGGDVQMETRAVLALYLKDRKDLWDLTFMTTKETVFRTMTTGPFLLAQELLELVKVLRVFEQDELKYKKREQMRILSEELFQKSLHPSRVARWVESGMDI